MLQKAPRPLTANHLWCQTVTAIHRPNGVLFLDRDGVVVEDTHHLCRAQDVRMISGAADLIRTANRANVAVVFVTNQSGIGQGLFGWDDFSNVQEEIMRRLSTEAAAVNMVLASPFHPKGAAPYGHPSHPFRKPLPGMLLTAGLTLNISLANGWIVGDRAGDMWAGRNAGLAGGIHVKTGYGREQRPHAEAVASDDFRVYSVGSIADAQSILHSARVLAN